MIECTFICITKREVNRPIAINSKGAHSEAEQASKVKQDIVKLAYGPSSFRTGCRF